MYQESTDTVPVTQTVTVGPESDCGNCQCQCCAQTRPHSPARLERARESQQERPDAGKPDSVRGFWARWHEQVAAGVLLRVGCPARQLGPGPAGRLGWPSAASLSALPVQSQPASRPPAPAAIPQRCLMIEARGPPARARCIPAIIRPGPGPAAHWHHSHAVTGTPWPATSHGALLAAL